MFGALGRPATGRHPWWVLAGWVVASVLNVATARELSATSDQSEFLPSKYESIRAANLQTDAFPQQTSVGALLVFDRADGGKLTPAAAEALKHAGPTVAATGLIPAGTFASLRLGGNSLLVALGFSISFGIFVAAFVMAMFLTPALTALIGHAARWPGHGEETRGPEKEPASV